MSYLLVFSIISFSLGTNKIGPQERLTTIEKRKGRLFQRCLIGKMRQLVVINAFCIFVSFLLIWKVGESRLFLAYKKGRGDLLSTWNNGTSILSSLFSGERTPFPRAVIIT